jgi:hypothetical protein
LPCIGKEESTWTGNSNISYETSLPKFLFRFG